MRKILNAIAVVLFIAAIIILLILLFLPDVISTESFLNVVPFLCFVIAVGCVIKADQFKDL